MALLTTVLATAFAVCVEAAPPTFIEPVAGSSAIAGTSTGFWMVWVSPGTSPASTGVQLTVDMRPFGGGAQVPFVDDRSCDDDVSLDLMFFGCIPVPFNAPVGTRSVTLTVSDEQGRSSSKTVNFTVLAAPDTDGDGMPDAWETRYGLDPNSGADAAGDPDGDSRTNLQEFQAATHPRGTFTRYFAEGAASRFFQTGLSFFNPGANTATVVVRLFGSDGTTTSTAVWVGSGQRAAFPSTKAWSPASEFGFVIESDALVVVERSMSWNGQRVGAHAQSAIDSSSTTWFVAEGATLGPFDLFYLLLNPGDQAALVTVTYLRPAPLPPVVRTYGVEARSRRTIWVDAADPALASTEVAAAFSSDRPIVVERAVYLSTASQSFSGGHVSAAVPAATTTSYLAEGAGGFFDTYLLVGNAGVAAATVTVTYLQGGGGVVTRTHSVPANSRVTIDVDNADHVDDAYGIVVESSGPVFVERATWWPRGQWREGHASAATPTAARKWALADGQVMLGAYLYPERPPGATETYFLIANPSATSGTVTVTLTDIVRTPSMTFDLPAHSRLTVPASLLLEATYLPIFLVSGWFAAIIESSGPDIVVECSQYRDAGGVFWAAGTSVRATPIP